jgi:regulator of nonsense transcripts 3
MKIPTSPAKPSRPSRAYLHVTSEDLIVPLSEKIRATSFHDARNTSNDPVLLGASSLEFAPYARIPSARVRKDGRQGTIDQDPEFIAFLESLTNPIPAKTTATTEAGVPAETTDGQKEVGEEHQQQQQTVKMTPLVQFIKDKKANKG